MAMIPGDIRFSGRKPAFCNYYLMFLTFIVLENMKRYHGINGVKIEYDFLNLMIPVTIIVDVSNYLLFIKEKSATAYHY